MYDSSKAGCVVYVGKMKLVIHLFVLCEVASTIKYIVFRWMGHPESLPHLVFEVFELFRG